MDNDLLFANYLNIFPLWHLKHFNPYNNRFKYVLFHIYIYIYINTEWQRYGLYHLKEKNILNFW